MAVAFFEENFGIDIQHFHLGVVYSAADLQEAETNLDFSSSYYPQMYLEVGVWFVAYCIVYAIIRYLILRRVRSYVEGSRKQRRITTQTCMSTVNAVVMTVYSLHYFLFEANGRRDDHVVASNAFHANAALCAYMISDLIHELPYAMQNLSSIFHHCTVMYFVLALVPIYPHVYRMIPWMEIAELSTIFLNLRWFARKYDGVKKLLWMPGVENSFGLTFFLCRCVMLPLTVKDHWEVLLEKGQIALFLCFLFMGLQFFWMYKIIVKIIFPSKD